MILWALLALATALAVGLMLHPLLGRRGGPRPRAEHDLAVYRDQLVELDRDRERGLVDGAGYEAARAEIARRMLAAERTGGATPSTDARAARILALVLVVAIPAGTLALYLSHGSPDLPGAPFAGRADERARAAAGAEAMLGPRLAQLEERAAARPEELETWQELGAVAAALGRFDQAVDAYAKAALLSGDRPDLLSAYGEALVQQAQGQVTPAAREAFEKSLAAAPREPRARYYMGLADAQAGRLEAALGTWMALDRDTRDGAPWLPALRSSIAQMANQLGIDPATVLRERTAGPTREQAEDAAEMPEEERGQMIAGMVEGLEARLAGEPGDLDGWLMLGRSRMVLGEPAKAAAAYATAAVLAPGDAEVLRAWGRALLAQMQAEEKPPEDLMPVMERLHEADPADPTALWMLGAAAAARSDHAEARRYWTELRDQLPEGSQARNDLEAQIADLPGD